jgi:signal transduction histidine kinase
VDSWDEALRPIDHPVALRAHPPLLHRAQVSAAELTTAQRRYGEFLASVSHELRTPLATIRNSVCVMDMPNAAAVERQKARTRIERQVGRMVRLVDDLLEVSRIGSPRFRLARARLDLRGVVQQAIETVESELNQRNHRLTVAMPAAPVWLHADCGRLEQVFVNLLVNAAKYTDVGGDLRLSVQHEHAEAIVRVRDSGIGIAPENLPHVFDLFIQVDRSSRRSEGGLGIGLALARCFVEAHGGRVKATSAGLGRGSEFTVRLPAS